MSFDFSTWELSRMLIALLLGIVLVAVPAAILLVRARHREIRLRRQIARLTTSQAVLGSNRSGQWRSDAATPESVEDDRPDAGAELGSIKAEHAPVEPVPEHHVRPEPASEPAERETTAQADETPTQEDVTPVRGGNRPVQPSPPPQRQPGAPQHGGHQHSAPQHGGHQSGAPGNGNGHPQVGVVRSEPQVRPERSAAEQPRDERTGYGQSRSEQVPASTPPSQPRPPEPERSPSIGDVPTQPVTPTPGDDSHTDRQPDVRESEPTPQPAHDQADSGVTFATEESAQRFRREYTEPMESSFRRIAELRTRLNGDTRERDKNSAGSH